MLLVFRRYLPALALFFSLLAGDASAQTPEPGASTLRELHASGMKSITETNVLPLAGLQTGSQVTRKDLQAAADRLVQSGLFAKVKYDFRTTPEGVAVTFHVEETPLIPAYFDNFPWFSDGELSAAIRTKLPFYDGSLPEAGEVVDQAGEALKSLLASRSLQIAVEHQVLA